MQRVSVVGVSGSGKTTFARALAASSGLPFVELDAIFHQPDWADLATEEFRAQVGAVVATDRWIVDGNYSAVQDLVWARADTVFWLDVGRPLVMRRVIARTLRRALTREVLWNGNREPLTNFYRWDPRVNIIRWSWVMYPTYEERYRAATVDPRYAHIEFIRVTSADDADRWSGSGQSFTQA